MTTKKTFDLRDEDVALIDRQVASGDFKNPDAVVQAGLTLLAEREAEIQKLRAEIQLGLDDVAAGRVTEFEGTDDFMKALVDRAAKR